MAHSTSSLSNSKDHPPTASDLLTRCQTLLSELELFKKHLKHLKQDHLVELAHFRNSVKSECRSLHRLAAQTNADATQHAINSSNLPFLETVWTTVKHSRGLQAVQKRFCWADKMEKKRGAKKQKSALVDVVAADGLHWFKVSLLTNNRLLFDKARQGWEDASSGDDEQESNANHVPLVKTTRDLVRAAQQVKIRTKHPRITLVLPKIQESKIPEIDGILDQLRSLHVAILSSANAHPPVQSFGSVMPNLLTTPFESFTSTVNIDCTILLALVSDFSHCQVEAAPWFHHALKRQVQIEDEENLLPGLLFPALDNKTLICTSEAAKRMREIVGTIGTATEKQRAALFMADAAAASPEHVRAELTKLSRFSIPGSLLLPIVVRSPSLCPRNLPPSAHQVRLQLTNINQSVFLHGWEEGVTTVTSNRTVVKRIEAMLDGIATSEREWPLIWLCPTARSLVGKEKGRKD